MAPGAPPLLKSSDPTHLIEIFPDVLLDVDLNFDMPSLGYVLVRNGNGRMMALAGQTGPPGVETWR